MCVCGCERERDNSSKEFNQCDDYNTNPALFIIRKLNIFSFLSHQSVISDSIIRVGAAEVKD